MPSQLTRPSTEAARLTTPRPTRRPGTIGLEIGSATGMALALLLGAGALTVSMPALASAALLVVAAAIITRALAVLAAEPAASRRLGPRELAGWDGTFAVSLATLAVVLAAAFATGAALVAAAGAIGMAALRLRTRYTAR